MEAGPEAWVCRYESWWLQFFAFACAGDVHSSMQAPGTCRFRFLDGRVRWFRPGALVSDGPNFRSLPRWLPPQSNFLAHFYPCALPSFLAYLIMQHSSSHPEPLHEPSTLSRMAGIDLNAPLEEEADAWLDLNIPVVQLGIGKFASLLLCFLASFFD